jgi:hypothetical protein
MHFIRDFKQFTSATPTSFKNFVTAPSVRWTFSNS